MTNPFEISDDTCSDILINISTGMHASEDVKKSLLSAPEMGNRRMEIFVNSAFSENESCSFYAPISRSQLQTFSDMSKKTKIKQQGRIKNTNISSELVFRRALTIANCRDDITVDNILSHPIGPVPISLFHEDGTMRKCTKAELGQKLEEAIVSQETLPARDKCSTIYIRDSMAVIQMIKGNNFETFNDLGAAYLRQLIGCFDRALTVVDVFDRYDVQDSVKSGERARRACGVVGARQYSVIGGRSIPPWKKFLAVPENKQSLTKFLCDYLVNHVPSQFSLHPEWKLVLAGGFADGKETKCVMKCAICIAPRKKVIHVCYFML